MDKAQPRLDDLFITKYLAKTGESVAEAKERLEMQRTSCLEKAETEKATKTRKSKVVGESIFKASGHIGQASFVDDQFVAYYLVRDGESVEDAKKRLKGTRLDKHSSD